jgi:heme-degrading monooxygenase HmoA
VGESVVVLLHHEAAAAVAELHEAYHRVSLELAGVPGLLGNELLESVTSPGHYVVLSRWATLRAFQEWEAGSSHQDATAALRPYRSAPGPSPYGVYRRAAGY